MRIERGGAIDSASRMNFRMVTTGPMSESGGMIAFTREPSGRRASTIGEASSQRRPSGATMRSMIRRTWSSFSNLMSVSSSRPRRSIQTWSGPLIMISLIDSSRRSGSIGPYESSSAMMASSRPGPLLPRQRHTLLVDGVVEQLLDGTAAGYPAEVGLGRELGDDASLDTRLQGAEVGAAELWSGADRRLLLRALPRPRGLLALRIDVSANTVQSLVDRRRHPCVVPSLRWWVFGFGF